MQTLAEVTGLAEKVGTDRAAFLVFFNSTVLASEHVRATARVESRRRAQADRP